MPNIMIFGFKREEAVKIRRSVEVVLKKIETIHDGITTIIPATTKCCHMNKQAPYLLVRDTKIDKAYKIAEALHAKLNLDTEFEQIGFIEAKPPAAIAAMS